MKHWEIASVFLFILFSESSVRAESSATHRLLNAMERFGQMGGSPGEMSPDWWITALRRCGVSPLYAKRRAAKARESSTFHTFISPQSRIVPLTFDRDETATSRPLGGTTSGRPVLLQATRLDVEEDYDDFLNDDLFLYFVTTQGYLTWGRVSSLYRGLDEGESVFLSADERPLSDPSGRFQPIQSPLFVDIGIVESDASDIRELQRLSRAILDIAVQIVQMESPEAGTAARRIREQTAELMRALIAMDENDRLVTWTLELTPETISDALHERTNFDFSRTFAGTVRLSDYRYKLWFRLSATETSRD